jgi:hypothetical protein
MNHQLVNHQLGTGGRDYGRRDITGYPGWRNPAAFIARIGENISPRRQQRTPASALPARLSGEITKELNNFRVASPQARELDRSSIRRPRATPMPWALGI